MRGDVDLSHLGSILADKTRASILVELLGGEPLPAGELARRAGATGSATSNHLRRLLDDGLVDVAIDGRRRLYSLSSRDVASALEALGRIAPDRAATSLRSSRRHEAIRDARTCYDHLAGRLGVGVTERLLAVGVLRACDGGYRLTARGERWFAELGIETAALRASRRRFAMQCVDLTERRPHLAGALGAALASAVKRKGYVAARRDSRALRLTESGTRFFAELGVLL